MYPAVANHAPQTAVVERVAREALACGVSSEGLPMMGAEDFSYFMMDGHGGKPGCFFFLGGFEEGVTRRAEYVALPPPGAAAPSAPPGSFEETPKRRSNCICHATDYDFNDNLLPIAARFWVRLVEARLGCELYSEEELPQEPASGARCLPVPKDA